MKLRKFWMVAAMSGSALAAGAAAAQTAQPSTTAKMSDTMKSDLDRTRAAADKDMKDVDAKAEAKGTEVKERAMGAMDKQELKTLTELHHGNQMEIQMGQLAAENAADSKVKDFGNQMVKDHTSMDKDVADFAKDHKLAMPDADAADATKPAMKKHMAMMDKMRAMKGPAFDRAYMSAMLKDHNEDVAKVTAARAKTADKDMQKLLDGALSTMKEHRKLVQDWMKKAPAHARSSHVL